MPPVAPPGRFEFRVGDEVASIVDGEARPGPVDEPDVLVEGDAQGIYYLFVDRRTDPVAIAGDHALLGRLLDVSPTPVAERIGS